MSLNKSLKFCLMTITIRSLFEENGKLYLQVFLDDTLYELNIQKTIECNSIDVSKGIDINKTNLSKNVIFVTIGILNISLIFVIDVMI